MKAQIRVVIFAVLALIGGGVAGYVKGVKDGSNYVAGSVQTMALSQSAKETALYAQMLRKLRLGDHELVTNRMESLLDHAIIQVGMFYAPQYDLGGWVGKSLALARDYRAIYPRTPSDAWTARRLNAAFSLRIDDEKTAKQ